MKKTKIKKIERIACPSCYGGWIPTEHKKDDTEITKCGDCGLVFVTRDSNEFANYESNPKYALEEMSEKDKERIEKSIEYITDKDECCEITKLLDVGCGNGFFIEELAKHGFKVSGIEINKECCKNLINKNFAIFNIDIVNEYVDFEKSFKFNCITFLHVFEHLYRFDRLFDNLKKILNDDGFIYCEVSNLEIYSNIIIDEGPYQEINKEHINHFNLTSLINLFVNNGFDIHEAGMINDSIYVLAKKIKDYVKIYLDDSEKALKEIKKKIEKKVKGKKIIVYGAAKFLTEIWDTLKDNCEILAVVDDCAKDGSMFYQFKVQKPSIDILKSGDKIFIASIASYDLIKSKLLKMGIKNANICSEL